MPLFDWAKQRDEARQRCGRVVLLHTCCDESGMPRAALIMPGERLPRVFPTVAAALVAQRQAEGWR